MTEEHQSDEIARAELESVRDAQAEAEAEAEADHRGELDTHTVAQRR